MGRHYAGQFPVLSNPWQAGSRRRCHAGPRDLLELCCSRCIWQWLSSSRVILRRWGEKSPAAAGGTQCADSSGVSTGGKGKGKYAQEILEPKRNNNLILSNNLLFMKHSDEGKKSLPVFKFSMEKKQNKTTNGSHGGKMQKKWKTFFCHHLPR